MRISDWSSDVCSSDLKEGSAIVNTTSVTAYRGSGHLIDYAATKGAIVAFSRSLAQALAKRKIRVNAVAPGPIWTPLIPASFPEEEVATFGTDVPLGRAGRSEEHTSELQSLMRISYSVFCFLQKILFLFYLFFF